MWHLAPVIYPCDKEAVKKAGQHNCNHTVGGNTAYSSSSSREHAPGSVPFERKELNNHRESDVPSASSSGTTLKEVVSDHDISILTTAAASTASVAGRPRGVEDVTRSRINNDPASAPADGAKDKIAEPATGSVHLQDEARKTPSRSSVSDFDQDCIKDAREGLPPDGVTKSRTADDGTVLVNFPQASGGGTSAHATVPHHDLYDEEGEHDDSGAQTEAATCRPNADISENDAMSLRRKSDSAVGSYENREQTSCSTLGAVVPKHDTEDENKDVMAVPGTKLADSEANPSRMDQLPPKEQNMKDSAACRKTRESIPDNAASSPIRQLSINAQGGGRGGSDDGGAQDKATFLQDAAGAGLTSHTAGKSSDPAAVTTCASSKMAPSTTRSVPKIPKHVMHLQPGGSQEHREKVYGSNQGQTLAPTLRAGGVSEKVVSPSSADIISEARWRGQPVSIHGRTTTCVVFRGMRGKILASQYAESGCATSTPSSLKSENKQIIPFPEDVGESMSRAGPREGIHDMAGAGDGSKDVDMECLHLDLSPHATRERYAELKGEALPIPEAETRGVGSNNVPTKSNAFRRQARPEFFLRDAYVGPPVAVGFPRAWSKGETVMMAAEERGSSAGRSSRWRALGRRHGSRSHRKPRRNRGRKMKGESTSTSEDKACNSNSGSGSDDSDDDDRWSVTDEKEIAIIKHCEETTSSVRKVHLSSSCGSQDTRAQRK